MTFFPEMWVRKWDEPSFGNELVCLAAASSQALPCHVESHGCQVYHVADQTRKMMNFCQKGCPFDEEKEEEGEVERS